MTKISGRNCEVRIATTEGGLATASVLTNMESIEWDADPSIKAEPKGMGFGRATEVRDGLLYYKGTIKKWYDTNPVVASPGTTTFAEMVGETQTGAMTKLYIQANDLDTGEVHTLKKVLGKYHPVKPVDAPQTETYDFLFEELTKA
jgi:hypothetical protein